MSKIIASHPFQSVWATSNAWILYASPTTYSPLSLPPLASSVSYKSLAFSEWTLSLFSHCLIVILCSSNSLKQLPRTICRLKNLRVSAEHTVLALWCLHFQQFFFSGDNKLQHLPADFGNLVHLEELDLSGCELVSLPESIARCSSLTKLWVSSNK